MKGTQLLCALVAAGLVGGAATAEETPSSITLTGVLRDFKTDHPDFEAYPGTSMTGIVTDRLVDGKPELHMDNFRNKNRTKAVHSPESFAQWFRSVPDVNIEVAHAITLTPHPNKPGVYWFAREKQMPAPDNYFFPLDGKGWGNSKGPLKWASPGSHNYHFTYELRTEFTYTPRNERDKDMVFEFTGDDDVWVYINGKLAVDLGGVHQQEKGSINLDTGKFKRYNAEGSKTHEKTIDLGLEAGKTYELVLFFAERHTSESNFRIETTMKLKEIPPTTISPLYD